MNETINLEELNIDDLSINELKNLLEKLYNLKESCDNSVKKLKDALSELDSAKAELTKCYKIDDNNEVNEPIQKEIASIDSMLSKINGALTLIEEKISKINANNDFEEVEL